MDKDATDMAATTEAAGISASTEASTLAPEIAKEQILQLDDVDSPVMPTEMPAIPPQKQATKRRLVITDSVAAASLPVGATLPPGTIRVFSGNQLPPYPASHASVSPSKGVQPGAVTPKEPTFHPGVGAHAQQNGSFRPFYRPMQYAAPPGGAPPGGVPPGGYAHPSYPPHAIPHLMQQQQMWHQQQQWHQQQRQQWQAAQTIQQNKAAPALVQKDASLVKISPNPTQGPAAAAAAATTPTPVPKPTVASSNKRTSVENLPVAFGFKLTEEESKLMSPIKKKGWTPSVKKQARKSSSGPIPQGMSVSKFKADQIKQLPRAFSFKLDDDASKQKAIEKTKEAKAKAKTKTAAKHSNGRKAAVEDWSGTPDEPVEGGWPKGWIKTLVKRQGGATAGSMDRYWYSPKTKKKFRSMAEIKRFFAALAQAGDDEDEAWRIFKGKK
eukprot:scaffold23834_cov55-Attheya_sp.AAC.2